MIFLKISEIDNLNRVNTFKFTYNPLRGFQEFIKEFFGRLI